MRALLLLLALGACGFAPAYAPGGSGDALRGRVAVEAPATPDGFLVRAAIEDRLGGPGAPLRLAVTPTVEASPAAITPEGAITRYDLLGRAAWTLEGAGRASGEVSAFTGYSATGDAVATRAAEEAARARLMALLADEVVARLLLLP